MDNNLISADLLNLLTNNGKITVDTIFFLWRVWKMDEIDGKSPPVRVQRDFLK